MEKWGWIFFLVGSTLMTMDSLIARQWTGSIAGLLFMIGCFLFMKSDRNNPSKNK